MANTCMTTYTFYSKNGKEMNQFYNFLTSLDNECHKNGIIIEDRTMKNVKKIYSPTYFLMQERLNIPMNDMVNAIGDLCMISKMYMKDDFYAFNVDMDEPWNAHPDVFQNILNWRFTSDIKMSYMGIEPGCGYFEIKDDAAFFPYYYFVSGDIESCNISDLNDNDQTIYKPFTTKHECVKFIEEVAKRVAAVRDYPPVPENTSLEELEAYIKDNFEDDDYLNVYQFDRT